MASEGYCPDGEVPEEPVSLDLESWVKHHAQCVRCGRTQGAAGLAIKQSARVERHALRRRSAD